jgi:hypothetical protein
VKSPARAVKLGGEEIEKRAFAASLVADHPAMLGWNFAADDAGARISFDLTAFRSKPNCGTKKYCRPLAAKCARFGRIDPAGGCAYRRGRRTTIGTGY